ncbi:MAG: tetratricopeptide repeat protein [Acidobacteriota bacterium]
MKKLVNSPAFVFVFLAVLTTRSQGQVPRNELARQHLESGIQFYSQGRYKQALNDFQIVATMPGTGYADDALLRIGEYYMEIEENFEEAQNRFEELLQRYPTENSAPGAYYYLGVLALRSTYGREGVDDALANFQRVIRLYRRSDWVPAALYSTGTAQERRGHWEEAADSYLRVVAEHPSSPWAAKAQLALGGCLVRLGKPVQGMIELQQVRNRYPENPAAEDALDHLTHLFRFYGFPRLGQPISYRVDPSFRARLADKFKDVVAVRISPQGIHVLERGRKRILTFDLRGKLTGTQSTVNPRGLAVDPQGALIVANEKGLVIESTPRVFTVPEEKGPRQLEKIRLATRDRLGDIYVYDERQKKILRFEPSGKLIGAFPDASPREILRMEVDRAGNLVFLEKKGRAVVIYSPTGQRRGRIEKRGEKWDFKKPIDIAVDPTGYLYLLDEERPQVAVFDPSYQLVTLLSEQNLGGGVLKKPVTLDVDASGDLYVYDDKEKALIRLH